MGIGRLARLVGIGLVVTVVIVVVIVGATALLPSSPDKHETWPRSAPSTVAVDPNTDIAIIVNDPLQWWAAVWVKKPLTADGYKQLAKSIGDPELQDRHGQVQVFDDKWARNMVLAENRFTELTDEEEKRWDRHLVMVYVHNADGFWFDR
jgi:hypothetical protein